MMYFCEAIRAKVMSAVIAFPVLFFDELCYLFFDSGEFSLSCAPIYPVSVVRTLNAFYFCMADNLRVCVINQRELFVVGGKHPVSSPDVLPFFSNSSSSLFT